MAPFEAILFDCDGTLMDTESQTVMAIEDVLSQGGVSGATLSASWASGRSWREITRALHQSFPLSQQISELEIKMIARWEFFVAQAPLLPGAKEALLCARHYFPLGLVTGSMRRSILPLFMIHGLDQLLPQEHWVCADDVEHCKPDPEGFLAAAARLGVAPERCLVFEDSVAGIEAAQAAGMTCIAVLETTAEPDVCLRLAGYGIQHYNALPHHFWSTLAQGASLSCALATPPIFPSGSTCEPLPNAA